MRKSKIFTLVLVLMSLTGCGTLLPILEAVAPSLEAGLANKGVNVSLDFGAILKDACLDADSELAMTLKDTPGGSALLPVLVPLCVEDNS